MEEILVSNICPITQISKHNDKPWIKLAAEAERIGEDVLFDFDDINLEEPWNNLEFKKLMQNEHVYLRVYSSDKVKHTIDLMCRMCNLKEGRVENIDRVYVSSGNNINKRMELLIGRIKDIIEVNENDKIAYIHICKTFDQIGSTDTVDAISETVKRFNAETGIVKYIMYTESMFIQENIIEALANLIGDMAKLGVDFKIMSDDPDTAGYIKTYQCVAGSNKLNDLDKVKIFVQFIPLNTIGMLTRYRDTKGKDIFGRKGDGKAVSCKPAVFRGLKKDDDKYLLVFDEYSIKTFVTRKHYEFDHDGEKHPGLSFNRIVIPIKCVGLANKFVGELYHFNEPIQFNPNSMIRTYRQESDGCTVLVDITLPEQIKDVANEFGLNINFDKLDAAIAETKRRIERSKEN